MPNNIAVIGDRDFISGFGALGCALYPVDEKTDLPGLWAEVVEANFLCIFILESYALKIRDLIAQYREESRPLIIPLADFRRDLSLSDELLSSLTIKAVGKDIIQGV
jgi:vacuolar-type H+-ATPase subunit F/Vma7